MSDKNGISRKDALKKIGGLALGSTMLSPLLAGQPFRHGFPNVITKRASDKPNILWITGEGVPISVLSCYGSRLMPTPNIDRIAKEGMLFHNSFVTNALCAPGRATLLTGKYSHLNGMVANPGATTQGQTHSTFDPSQQTFPRIMQQHGYQTGTVGKWHLVSAPGKPSNPAVAGFDYFVFKRGAGGPYYDSSGFFQNPGLGSNTIEKASYKGYATDTFTDLAIKGIEQFNKPWMMMVQYFNDHRPFQPPHKYEHIFDDYRFPEPGTFWDDYSMRASPAREARMRIGFMPDFDPPEELTDRQRKQWNYQQFMAHFMATLKSQDDNIGRLLHYLDEKGLAENTIVVYTSDHGFFMGEHGWFDKRFMYEPAIRVPWIIRYPGQVKAGSRSDDWIINIDNAPTVLDLVNLPVPSDMQGRSAVALLKGNTPPDWQKSYYYHYYEFAPPHWVVPHYGIRTEKYKLISYYTINEWELFDLEKDPDEIESLFEWSGYKVNPAYEDISQDLVKQLKQLRSKYKDTTGKPVKLWPTSSYD